MGWKEGRDKARNPKDNAECWSLKTNGRSFAPVKVERIVCVCGGGGSGGGGFNS